MAGFRKAKPEQAALKDGFYGPPGSGKTLTALLCAEGLAKITKKRIAYVDTERGTDFYAQDVPQRAIHPKGFDFDAIYTRSITEVLKAVKGLDPNEYCCIIIDSITHIWEAAKLAYSGRLTKAGTVPFHAWGQIKKPYKDLMSFLLSSPMHVFILGRQGNEFEEDEETEELKKVGVKMKAEGETAHEPHILIRMEAVRGKDGFVITAIVEKDRSGILTGQTIAWPNFDSLIKPILPLLGTKQAQIEDADEVANHDAETLSVADTEREEASKETMDKLIAQITLCGAKDGLKSIAKELITPEVKKKMLPQHVAQLREFYLEAEKKLK